MEGSPLLKLERVGCVLDGVAVLSDVSMEVRRGELVCLLGPTGSGKTTALKVAIGLVPAAVGRVMVFGREMTRATEEEWNRIRGRCGMVFQHGALFDYMTALENVLFALRARRDLSTRERMKMAKEALERVGLNGAEGLYPSQLSGGMRKKVALARALVTRPEILLCDEPTQGLDPSSASEVWGIILSEVKGRGVGAVVTTHEVRFALGRADRVVILDRGRVVAVGPPEEVASLSHPTVRAILVGGGVNL